MGSAVWETLTGLVIQQVVLLEQLPVHQEALGSSGWVEHTWVFVQQLLEQLQLGLAGLQHMKKNSFQLDRLLRKMSHPCWETVVMTWDTLKNCFPSHHDKWKL